MKQSKLNTMLEDDYVKMCIVEEIPFTSLLSFVEFKNQYFNIPSIAVSWVIPTSLKALNTIFTLHSSQINISRLDFFPSSKSIYPNLHLDRKCLKLNMPQS